MLALARLDPNDTAAPAALAARPPERQDVAWERGSYAPPRGARPAAASLTALVIALLLACLLIRFGSETYVAPRAQAPLTMTLLPLASPPVEKRDKVKPMPEKKQAQRKPERPETNLAPMPIVPMPFILPSLPSTQSTAPVPQRKQAEDAAPPTLAAPPAPQVSSNAPDTWQGRVLARLGKFRRYPAGARGRREEGVPYIRFTMERNGTVLSSTLERSSGFADLDREAVRLPKRAQPLPKPPSDVVGDTIELVVPVEFVIH
jgi:protein TonB